MGGGCRVPSSKMPKAPGTGLPCSVEQTGKYVAKLPLGLCSWACVLPVRLHLGVSKGRGGPAADHWADGRGCVYRAAAPTLGWASSAQRAAMLPTPSQGAGGTRPRRGNSTNPFRYPPRARESQPPLFFCPFHSAELEEGCHTLDCKTKRELTGHAQNPQ